MDATKYRVGYFPVDKKYNKWVEKDHVEKAPVWCSVDMRDGNQALVIPMSLEEKLEYYKVLLEVGFKGYRTADIMSEGGNLVGCSKCGELICENLRKGC